MRDAEHPTYMWGASVSEVDGRYLYLYTSKDTSRVCLDHVIMLSLHNQSHYPPEKPALDCGPDDARDRREHEMDEARGRVRS